MNAGRLREAEKLFTTEVIHAVPQILQRRGINGQQCIF